MSYLCYLCLFANSGVHQICDACLHIVYFSVSLNCPFLLAPSVYFNFF